MNSDQFKGRYTVIKGKMKEKYGILTDDDLIYEEGREDQFIGRIEKKTGDTKEKIKELIESIQNS